MNELYFLVRYTPFWAIPIGLIAAEFSYKFWLRKKKKMLMLCVSLGVFCFVCVVSYYIIGGPEKSVNFIKWIYWQLSH